MNQEFDKVKRLFLKPFKPRASQQPPPTAQPASVQQTAHTTGLQPKFVVPPVPHPCPHDSLAILASPSGLLVRPYLNGRAKAQSHVRITWGRDNQVEEIHNDGEADGLDWPGAAISHGIVGILSLFAGTVYSLNLHCNSRIERRICCQLHIFS